MAGVVNAHSLIWNSHYHRRQNATILEDIIEQFGLLINNKPGRATRPSSREISIIDLAISSPQLGPLTLWEIPDEYPSLSNHELIVLRWEDVDYNSANPKDGQITGWDIQGLINDEKSLQAAELDWVKETQNRPILNASCTRQELDEEVEWVEALLTHILNTIVKRCESHLFLKDGGTKK